MPKKEPPMDPIELPPTSGVAEEPATEAPPQDVAPPIDPQLAILVRFTEAMERLTERMAQPQSSGDMDRFERMMDTLSTAMERVSQSNITGAKLIVEENRQAHRPSNTVVPNCSVFNRRGEKFPKNPDGTEYVKPRLKCKMMIPWYVEDESCTREEVELLNLLEPGTYAVKRNDGTRVVLTCEMTYKADMVTPSRLVVNHETAFNNDNHRMMPPLTEICRQMLKQHAKPIPQLANNVLTDEEEQALIEAGELLASV